MHGKHNRYTQSTEHTNAHAPGLAHIKSQINDDDVDDDNAKDFYGVCGNCTPSSFANRPRLPRKTQSVMTPLSPTGTYCYIAPEVMRRERYGVRSDVFSFAGRWAVIFEPQLTHISHHLRKLESRTPCLLRVYPVILCELVSGRFPFESEPYLLSHPAVNVPTLITRTADTVREMCV